MKFFSKQLKLPSKKEMLKDTNDEMENRWKQGLKKRQAHMMGPVQVCSFHYFRKKNDFFFKFLIFFCCLEKSNRIFIIFTE